MHEFAGVNLLTLDKQAWDDTDLLKGFESQMDFADRTMKEMWKAKKEEDSLAALSDIAVHMKGQRDLYMQMHPDQYPDYVAPPTDPLDDKTSEEAIETLERVVEAPKAQLPGPPLSAAGNPGEEELVPRPRTLPSPATVFRDRDRGLIENQPVVLFDRNDPAFDDLEIEEIEVSDHAPEEGAPGSQPGAPPPSSAYPSASAWAPVGQPRAAPPSQPQVPGYLPPFRPAPYSEDERQDFGPPPAAGYSASRNPGVSEGLRSLPNPVLAPETGNALKDEALSNMLQAWYWTGFYNALHLQRRE